MNWLSTRINLLRKRIHSYKLGRGANEHRRIGKVLMITRLVLMHTDSELSSGLILFEKKNQDSTFIFNLNTISSSSSNRQRNSQSNKQ